MKKGFWIISAAICIAMASSSSVFAEELPYAQTKETVINEAGNEQPSEDGVSLEDVNTKQESVVIEESSEAEENTDTESSIEVAESEEQIDVSKDEIQLAEEKGQLHQEVDDACNKYMVYDDGSHYTGWYNMEPFGWLYFNPENDGAANTGICQITEGGETKTYAFDANGINLRISGTPIIDGNKYWITVDGNLGQGWLYLGNWKMYFDTETYIARTALDGVTDIDGKKYLFNEDGVMQTFAGTTIVNGRKYWFSTDDASLKSGWLTLGDWKLYFDTQTYEGATGVKEIDGKNYIFDKNGVNITGVGTFLSNGNKYYIDSDGNAVTGWVTLGDWKLYFDPETGICATGITTVEGKTYNFNSDGICLGIWLDAGKILDEDEIDLNDISMYFGSYEISDDIFKRIYGKSYKTYCTVPRSDLRYLKLLHRGFDGKIYVGELMVNKAIADEILEIFTILFQNDYQIESMYLVDDFNADDRMSIDANNTSAFNFRAVTDNPNVLSYHGMGIAIDINPINNPFIWLENGIWTYEDRDAGLYLDRYASDAAKRHMINHNDLCYKLFTERGYTWGGDWYSPKDYQHFEKAIVNYSM